jgi:RNA polymerase sigma-70 factor, ECF subfamily
VTPSEGWLVLKAQAGDRDALDHLLRGINDPLLRFVTRMTGDRTAADDILQDTLLIVARKLQWLDRPEAFRAWAYRIAARTAIKALRRERRRFLLIDRAADVEAAQALIVEPPSDLAERLPELVASVSPASRAVLLLHFMEGLPLQAVSDILEIPLGTVKSRLAYGLRLLRERVNP